MTDRLSWLRLSRTENVGPVTFRQLLARFGTAEKAIEALPELAARGGLKRKLTVPTLKAVEDEIRVLEKRGAQILTWGDDAYPKLLAQTPDAPPVLLVEGHAPLLNKQPLVAMVGARNASLNGRRYAEKLARELGEAGIIVVSGLAAGIDASAHQGALATGTIGVIAGGFDHVYPPENAGLYDKLQTQGAIVTEMPLGTPIRPQLFPRRNRIVSGLCRGVIVVEAALQSGSLITARLAGEQGREVMAVPGSPMDPRAAGTNRLIKDGATLVESAMDVTNLLNQQRLEESELPLFAADTSHKIDENQADRARAALLGGLAPTPTPVDELIRLCDFPAPIVWAALLELELAGRILRLPGNQVALLLEARTANAE
jgi:DNA processing protein